MRVIGIDAGGTRTVCQLADASGRILATERGGGANLYSEGESGVEGVLQPLIARLSSASGPAHPISAIGAGMAGVARATDAAAVRQVLDRLLPGVPSVVVSDALAALEAGTHRAAALVLISGTGSIALGRDDHARTARAGGWGYVLGDEGSGYWLGRNALRSVVRAADGRGPATSLTERVLAHYGVSTPQQLVHAIAGPGTKPSAIAQLAMAVGDAAAEGDALARHLIDRGAEELASAAASVARRLALDAAPLWLAGGTLLGVTALQESVIRELGRVLPGLAPAPLGVEPVTGAVRLALDLAAGTLTPPVES
jgi:N-acetylglucosamine kinase-like BadF-type ATPase